MRRGEVRPERVALFVPQFDRQISGVKRLSIAVYGAVPGIQAHVGFDPDLTGPGEHRLRFRLIGDDVEPMGFFEFGDDFFAKFRGPGTVAERIDENVCNVAQVGCLSGRLSKKLQGGQKCHGQRGNLHRSSSV